MSKILSLGLVVILFAGVNVSVGLSQDKPKDKLSVEERFKRLDANADGKLSEEEFVRNAKDDKAEKAKMLFARMDANSDKSVSLEEFQAAANKKKKN